MMRIYLFTKLTVNMTSTMTVSKYDADKVIYFVDSKYDADLLIYFVDSKYDAEWMNKSRKYLVY